MVEPGAGDGPDNGKLRGGNRPGTALPYCGQCGAKQPAHRCANCGSVAYCSRPCQQKHWVAGHKHECKKLRKAAAADARRAAAAGNSGGDGSSSGGGASERPEESNSMPPLPKQVLFPPERYAELAAAPPARKAPLGLSNVGNSCYANSLLQGLLATPTLAAYLVSGEHSGACPKASGSDFCALCELEALAQQAYRPGGSGALNPRPLLRHVKKLGRQFSFGRQEDSHELYLRLMEAVEAAQLREAGGKDKFDLRSRETTFIHQAFCGYTRTAVECLSCGHVSKTFECCTSLALEVSARLTSLEAALARFAATERLDGDNKYRCDACRAHVAADKYTRLEAGPHYLQICLKRFAPGRFGKITSKLSYPERLDLSPYLAPGAVDNASGPPTYNLYAVVVHIDWGRSTDYGHYIAYVRSGDSWHCCDDSSVTPVAAAKALAAGAYLLFYERDQPRRVVPAGDDAAGAAAPKAGEAAGAASAASAATAVAADSEAASAAAAAAGREAGQEGEASARMLRVETAPAALPHLGAEEEAEEHAPRSSSDGGGSSGSLTPAASGQLDAQLAAAEQQQQQGLDRGTPERLHASASEGDLSAARQRSRPSSAACSPAAKRPAEQQQQQHAQEAAAAAAQAAAEVRQLQAEASSPRSDASASDGSSSKKGPVAVSNPFDALGACSEEDEEGGSAAVDGAEIISSSSGGNGGSGDNGGGGGGAAEGQPAAAPEQQPLQPHQRRRDEQQGPAGAPQPEAAAALPDELPGTGGSSSSAGGGGSAAVGGGGQAAAAPGADVGAEAACETPRHRASVTSGAGGQRVLRLSVDLPGVERQEQVDWKLAGGGGGLASSASQLLQLRAKRWRLALPLPVRVAAEGASTKWRAERLVVRLPLAE